jgi:hypothetical protein
MLQKLKYIDDNKIDVVVPVNNMAMLNDGRLGYRKGNENTFLNMNPFAQRKLATYCDVPTQYFERLFEQNRALAAHNINNGLAIAAQKR